MLGARRGLLGGMVAVVLLALLAGSADADRLADKRAEATRVEGQLAQMDADLSKAIEAYDAAQTRLEATEAAIRENQLELAITKKNLAIAQTDLTQQLVADYRSGSPDTIGVLLGAASISDMLERIDIVKRSSGHTAQLVGKVLTFQKQIETTSVKLAKQQKARQQALADRAARKTAIRQGIAARHDRLASLNGEIRQIIAERAAAERAAAQRRAEAARAAQQAAAAQPAQDDPGVGGSSGGVDTGGGGGGGGRDTPRRGRRPAGPGRSGRRRLLRRRRHRRRWRWWRRRHLRRWRRHLRRWRRHLRRWREHHSATALRGRLVRRGGGAVAARRAVPLGRRL